MVSAARESGKFIRKVMRSPLWREMVETSNEIRELPRKIVREAGIENDLKDLRDSTRSTIKEINRTKIPMITPVKISPEIEKPNLTNPPKNEKKDDA
jgi:hypothetical protein